MTDKSQKNITKISTIVLIIILTFTAVCTIPVYADDEETQRQIDELQGQVSDAQGKASSAKSNYNKLKAAENQLAAKVKSIQGSINKTQGQLNSLAAQITEKESEIDAAAKALAEKEAEVTSQQSDLNERLRLMYMSGDTSLLEVLLGSDGIVDFLSNLDMVKAVHEYDMDLLAKLSDEFDAIDAQKKELEELRAMLETNKKQQEEKKQSLKANKADLDVAKAQAAEASAEAWAEYEALEAISNQLEQQLRNLQSNLTYGGGAMSWPCYGVATSEYGYRIHPVYGTKKLHTGLDIGVSYGTPIKAAADGVVYMASWYGGYGNCVIIDHGSGITTLYGHNSSLTVKAGQKVTRGQTVAKAGSTGVSTGNHCHFEVRVNGVTQNPRNWL
jgi:murein DD-endopeptidase MepM/ murein hydrolase activator NlpD